MVLLITHFYNIALMAKCFLATEVAGWLSGEGFFGHLPTGSDFGETVVNCSVGVSLLVINSEYIIIWKPRAFGIFPHILETCNTKGTGTSTFLLCSASFPGLNSLGPFGAWFFPGWPRENWHPIHLRPGPLRLHVIFLSYNSSI